MKRVIYLCAAAALMCGCADKVTGPDNNEEGKTPIELRGSVDRIPVLDKEKAFYLYALLSPGDEWTAFYIDKESAKLSPDGTVSTGTELFWPQDDNMYRFVGVMNAADQAQPVVNMSGPVVSLSAGDTPANDLLLSNNLSMRRTSVDDRMVFRHVMTQVVFEMVIDDAGDKAYTLTGTAAGGKQTGTYSILATPKTDLATLSDDAADYTLNLALEATAANRTPRSVHYLVPDGSALTTLTGVKLNGADDTDIPLLTEQGDPITLRSGNSYIVKLHVTQGVVSATISVGEWLEEDLGDQNADVAMSEVKWTLTYPQGVDKISKLEVVDGSGKTYFAAIGSDGGTLSPVDLPAAPQTMAVWLGNARVELRPEEYTFADNRLDINVSYVTTAQELAAIAMDGSYRQAAHIDLGAGHTPIGTSAAPFTGTFDGGGYRMENLKFTTSGQNVGLFSYNAGTIRNVTIGKGKVTGMTTNNGLLCARNTASGVIEGCVNLADFECTATSGYYMSGMIAENLGTVRNCDNYGNGTSMTQYFAGVVGRSAGNSVTESCRNFGNITAAKDYVGGVVCFAEGAAAVVADCQNHGAVKATGPNAGGIAGRLVTASILRSVNTGAVSSDDASVGGIVGTSNNGTIEQCTNSGSVNGATKNIGGIAGYMMYGGRATLCVNTGTVTAKNVYVAGNFYTGGIVGNSHQAQIDHCINAGVVTGTLYAGGICGGGDVLSTTTITACMNQGTVSTGLATLVGTAGWGVSGIGGIIGCTLTGPATTVTACVNTGKIRSINGAGGIVGRLEGATVTACYSVGDVEKFAGTAGSGEPYPNNNLGGVSGWVYNQGGAYSAYYAGNATVGDGWSNSAKSRDYTRFSATAWPAESTHAGWKLASNGGYWESLGSWNAGTPTYPKLAGLPTIP